MATASYTTSGDVIVAPLVQALGQRDLEEGIGLFCPGGAQNPVIGAGSSHDRVRPEDPGTSIARRSGSSRSAGCCSLQGLLALSPPEIGSKASWPSIAPSTYDAHVAQRADPAKASAKSRRDAELSAAIKRVFEANFEVYGALEIWRQLGREDIEVARCPRS